MISPEKHVQILLSLLKKAGIRKVVASPGNTNVALIISMQEDRFFEIISVVDERSAAYVACGIAQEAAEPVVISCTGATASRNYLPGLTEAYYRGLPVLAITSTQTLDRVGHLIPQVIDRSTIPNDVARYSVSLPVVGSVSSSRQCQLQVNNALNYLVGDECGPVHLNLPTTYEKPFLQKANVNVSRIEIFRAGSLNRPAITHSKVGIFIGSGLRIDQSISKKIDKFCERYNGCVFVDATSNYRGNYAIRTSLLGSQTAFSLTKFKPDLVIHVGFTSGDYFSPRLIAGEVWRVSSSSLLEDTFGLLSAQFDISLSDFLDLYIADKTAGHPEQAAYFQAVKSADQQLREKISHLPFSNASVCKELSERIPDGAIVHLGILNSLRCWNFFATKRDVTCYSNVGGFGIDGPISTAVGTALSDPNRLNVCIVGDLAFFYDLNIFGNRQFPKNLRIILINNATGVEFRQKGHHAESFGELGRTYVSAEGHNGAKSGQVLPAFLDALGVRYKAIWDQSELSQALAETFSDLSPAMVLEVFTCERDEVEALSLITTIDSDVKGGLKKLARDVRNQLKRS